MAYRKKRDKEVERAGFSFSYQAKIKSQYKDNKPALPIFVSANQIKRAYRILDALIKTVSHLESWVSLGHYDKKDTASITIMNVSFRFELKETETKPTSKNKTKNSGAMEEDSVLPLILSFTVNESTWNRGNTECLEFKDTPSEPLEEKLDRVISDMFIAANRFRARDELYDRELEKKWAEEKRLRHLQEMKRREEENVKILERVVNDWDLARKIREFADSLEKSLEEAHDKQWKENLVEKAKWARSKADWLDPLVAKEDDLLGKKANVADLLEYSITKTL